MLGHLGLFYHFVPRDRELCAIIDIESDAVTTSEFLAVLAPTAPRARSEKKCRHCSASTRLLADARVEPAAVMRRWPIIPATTRNAAFTTNKEAGPAMPISTDISSSTYLASVKISLSCRARFDAGDFSRLSSARRAHAIRQPDATARRDTCAPAVCATAATIYRHAPSPFHGCEREHFAPQKEAIPNRRPFGITPRKFSWTLLHA